MEVVRNIVHDDIEKSLLLLNVLTEKIVVNLNTARMVQQLNYLEFPVGKLRILKDLFDCVFSIGNFFYHFEDLSEGSFSYRLDPLIAVCFVLRAFPGICLIVVNSLRVVFPRVSSGIFEMQIFIFSHWKIIKIFFYKWINRTLYSVSLCMQKTQRKFLWETYGKSLLFSLLFLSSIWKH